jgi:hypothetical protein
MYGNLGSFSLLILLAKCFLTQLGSDYVIRQVFKEARAFLKHFMTKQLVSTRAINPL